MLVLWLLLILGVPHVVAGLIQVGATLVGRRTAWGGSWADLLSPFLQPLARVYWRPGTGLVGEWLFWDWPSWWKWLIVGVVAMPVGLGLMPISLRRASVRWVHVWRASVYSGAVPGLYFVIEAFQALMGVALWALFFPGRPVGGWTSLSRVVILKINGWTQSLFDWFGLIAIVWLAVWWLFVLQRGWKLQHGWAVWLSLVVIVSALVVAVNGVTIQIGARVYRI